MSGTCWHCGQPEHAGEAGPAIALTPLQYVRRQRSELLRDEELDRAGDWLAGYIASRRRRGVPVLGTIQDEVRA